MSHSHAHSHSPASTNRTRLAVGVLITLGILAAEVVGAALTGSLALLVDAAHVLTDSFGLVIALFAASLTMRPVSSRRTWGWQRAEILAAGGQAAILLGVGAWTVVEGARRLLSPAPVDSHGVLLVGLLGLLGNIATLLVLRGGQHENLNMRAASLEVAADALGSVAVLVAGGVIALTGWQRADTVAGLAVALLIIPRAAMLLCQTGSILLESAPQGLDLTEVKSHILGQPHVVGVHDLHASVVATGLPVLTGHVVLSDECFTDGHSQEILRDLLACAATHHTVSVEHTTFQLETAALAAAHGDTVHAW